MPLETLEQSLKEGLKPVYLIAGPQPYQLEMALTMILHAQPRGGMQDLNQDVFHVGQDDLSGVIRLANSLPMLSRSRVIVLHDVSKLKDKDRENIVEYLASPAPFTNLIMLADKIDHRSKLSKLAKQHGLVLEFERLYESQMRPWVALIAREQGVTLNREAAEYLMRHVGADLEAVAREIEKAALHAGNDKISVEDISAVIASVKEQPFYNLVDAVTNRQTGDALLILKQMLDQGEPPLAILAMLGRQIRQLVIACLLLTKNVSENEAMSALGMAPFLARKTMEQARKYSPEALRDSLLELSRYDLELKDARSSDRVVLEKLILALCRRI